MRKRLFIILAAVVAVMLTLVAYRHYRWQQRERRVELLTKHFDAYRREHGGHSMPPDLQALAAWRPLEPELRHLVETGHVIYKAPKELSLGYPYAYAIDGDGRLCELVP